MSTSKFNKTKVLAFSGIALALAFVTSLLKIIPMPFGGSLTLCSMLFVCIIGYWFGLKIGLTAAFAYGLLQLAIEPIILFPFQVILDYFLAFGALGLAGIFSNKKNGLILGFLVGAAGRFVFVFLSGVLFWGEYAPEGWNPVLYSLAYNGIYVGGEAVLTVALLCLPPVRMALQKVKTVSV